MKTVIRIDKLGKCYSLPTSARLTSLRDMLSWPKRRHAAEEMEFWALRHFSLNIHRGDRIGVIGGNGSGKSTLLKILSGITTPTEGRAVLNGRVSSMLEVGTGFHPELSGRENVFLNGAILGMTRAEIRERFDAIVQFAGVEKFIDMPVKRYSSGMYVRLAFAVAAHLDSELLLLDEVLAVGDADFQDRCLDKMRTITADEGRTIIFVSHNLAAVRALCNRAVVLRKGERISVGDDVNECIDLYLSDGGRVGNFITEWRSSADSFRHNAFTPLRLALSRIDGEPLVQPVSTGCAIRLDFSFEAKRVASGLYFDFVVSSGGVPLFSASPWENPASEYRVAVGENHVGWIIPPGLLNALDYHITLRAMTSGPGGFRMPMEGAPQLRLPISVRDYRMACPASVDRRLLHPELQWIF